MIESLRGTLEALSPDSVLLRLGGVTLRVAVSHTTVQSIGASGSPAGGPGRDVCLYTYLHLREDALALYGFATVEERELFLRLLRVNGVGPRLALAVCSLFPPARLAEAIAAGDVDALARVPGIGKRLAGRLVLELRGHLAEQAPQAAQADAELLSALLSLGYTRGEAMQSLESLSAEAASLAFEERLRAALRYFIPR